MVGHDYQTNTIIQPTHQTAQLLPAEDASDAVTINFVAPQTAIQPAIVIGTVTQDRLLPLTGYKAASAPSTVTYKVALTVTSLVENGLVYPTYAVGSACTMNTNTTGFTWPYTGRLDVTCSYLLTQATNGTVIPEEKFIFKATTAGDGERAGLQLP